MVSAFTFYTNTGECVSECAQNAHWKTWDCTADQPCARQLFQPCCSLSWWFTVVPLGNVYGPYGDTTHPDLNATTVTGRQLWSMKIRYGWHLHEVTMKFILCDWTGELHRSRDEAWNCNEPECFTHLYMFAEDNCSIFYLWGFACIHRFLRWMTVCLLKSKNQKKESSVKQSISYTFKMLQKLGLSGGLFSPSTGNENKTFCFSIN